MRADTEVSFDRLTSVCMDLAAASARVKSLRHDRDREIIALLERGFTTEQVAELAGITQPRCVQIRHEHKG